MFIRRLCSRVGRNSLPRPAAARPLPGSVPGPRTHRAPPRKRSDCGAGDVLGDDLADGGKDLLHRRFVLRTRHYACSERALLRTCERTLGQSRREEKAGLIRGAADDRGANLLALRCRAAALRPRRDGRRARSFDCAAPAFEPLTIPSPPAADTICTLSSSRCAVKAGQSRLRATDHPNQRARTRSRRARENRSGPARTHRM